MALVDDYIEWMKENLVHASFKTGNSNASAGGIRLCADQAFAGPYVCARTHLADQAAAPGQHLHLDYIANNNLFKSIRVCLGEEVAKPVPTVNLSEPEKQRVKQAYEQLAAGSEGIGLGTDKVSMRLKQLLIPKGEGYVAVTPITSTGHAKLVLDERRRRNDVRRETQKEINKLNEKRDPSSVERARALKRMLAFVKPIASVRQFSIGGANAQNSGGRIFGALNAPLVFDNVPRASESEREAFRIAFKGIDLRIPRALVEPYRNFLITVHNKAIQDGGGGISWTKDLREREAPYLEKIWSALERQAEKASRLLRDHADLLPDPLPCAERNPGLAGWLNRAQRGLEWRDAQARWLAQRLGDYRLGQDANGTPITLGLSKSDLDRIIKTLMES